MFFICAFWACIGIFIGCIIGWKFNDSIWNKHIKYYHGNTQPNNLNWPENNEQGYKTAEEEIEPYNDSDWWKREKS